MEMAEALIFDASWLFFLAWGIVLAAVGIIAFGQDILGFSTPETGDKSHQG